MVEVYNQITKEIKGHDTIFIMGHQGLDFDALGSALCLYEIGKSFGKGVKCPFLKVLPFLLLAERQMVKRGITIFNNSH